MIVAWLIVCLAGVYPAVARASEPEPITQIHFLIPGSAGGGWDLTARAVGQVLRDTELLPAARFENLAGGGGGRAIAHLIEVARDNMLMVNSTPIVVRSLQQIFPQSFRDLTPVASVIGDYSAMVVRTESPYTNLAQLGAAQRAEPRAVAIAGGSVRGSTDHIVAAMMFKGLGASASSVKYIPYDTGGKAMVGLLSGEVAALSSGYGEVIDLVEQGYVRILCIAAPGRLPAAPQTPTCTEAGSAGTVFVNWRGFFAAPDVPQERVVAWQALLTRMQQTEQWAATKARYGWVDLLRTGDGFIALLEEQEAALRGLMIELGMLRSP